jgi:iron complex transport system ATP-binding protein
VTIAIEKLSFAYGRAEVLHEVTARAESGRITSLIGPNAAGKSTLLRCVIGSLRPMRGRALIDGQPSNQMSPRALARTAAYVSQRPLVSAAFTVRQVVELGRFALDADSARVSWAIERLDLAGIAHRPFMQLSVGQQQRVMLARAIAQLGSTGHLILDEPVSSMDLHYVHACMEVLRELACGGATVVLAMHDLSLAAALADDVWLLDAGRIVRQGAAKDELTTERLNEVFGVVFQWLEGPWGSRVLVARQPASVTADTMGSS